MLGLLHPLHRLHLLGKHGDNLQVLNLKIPIIMKIKYQVIEILDWKYGIFILCSKIFRNRFLRSRNIQWKNFFENLQRIQHELWNYFLFSSNSNIFLIFISSLESKFKVVRLALTGSILVLIIYVQYVVTS